ncbi:MAG: energy transducer TonB [Carboxylicivirga sp.]|jgi:protein TonB|nr:energy transducer TonB [Carboxylicivirga sp.]
MKVTHLITLLFVICISLNGQESHLIDFYPSTCDKNEDVTRLNKRVSDIFIQNDTLYLTLTTIANCGLNTEQLKADAIYFNDTLYLSFEQPEIIIDTLNTGETEYTYNLSMEDCDCCFQFMYVVKDIPHTSIPIKLNKQNINFSEEKYKTHHIRYQIHNGDTINYIDKYGLHQGKWLFYNQSNQLINNRFYRNDTIVFGTDLRYDDKQKLLSKIEWINNEPCLYSEFDQHEQLIGKCLLQSDPSTITHIDTIDNQKAVLIVELMPEYPGGETALFKYLAENIKQDTKCIEDFQTTVNVSFIIDTLGNVRNTTIVNQHPTFKLTEFEKNVFQVIKSMPKWKPGEHQGKKVPVLFHIPIRIDPQFNL